MDADYAHMRAAVVRSYDPLERTAKIQVCEEDGIPRGDLHDAAVVFPSNNEMRVVWPLDPGEYGMAHIELGKAVFFPGSHGYKVCDLEGVDGAD